MNRHPRPTMLRESRKAIEAGFNHHLVKPTSIEELTQLLLTLPHAD